MTPTVAPDPTSEESDRIIPLFADGARGENVNDAYRLERAIKRVQKLLDDPDALIARAQALFDGTAKPLLALAVVGLTALRFFGGPLEAPSIYLNGLHYRRAVVQNVVTVPVEREVA